MLRSSLLKLLLAAVALAPLAAFPQAWPSKPIRWLVPFPPGGSTDIATRPLADAVGQALAQPGIVENRVGAGGNIGIESVAKSAPDGYTLLVAPDTITSNPHLYKVSWDPFRDFVPVIQLARQPVVLAVHPSIGVASVAELVATAKREPGLGYATSGAGSQQHLAAEWFASVAGIQLTHVPYKGGGQAITDLVAGQIRIGSLGSSPVIPHYRAGKLRLLAQSTKARAEPARGADIRGGGHQGTGARPVARRVRPCRHFARGGRAAERGDREGARRPGDHAALCAGRARADRRHVRRLREAGA
jgi:tripartite-type tricarboxylate transporter receptor subunit TctC